MSRRNYYNGAAFLDLLFNTLVGFVLLFFLSFLMIHPAAKKAELETKAEYVVSVTWQDNSEDDVDTWLQDPLGNIVHFRQKDSGMAHLDRDDLGSVNDVMKLPDGRKIEYPHNQELTSIRGFIKGEWVLNVHMYNKRDKTPTNVEVRIEKLNPVVKTVFLKNIVMTRGWEEVTACRFVMSERGDILKWDDLPKRMIEYVILNPT